MKILLDTDIGTDSDDAVCLAYLLLREDCDLVGITTVGRDAGERAAVARKLCAHFDRPEVPVVAGASRPLLPNRYWWGHRVNHLPIVDDPVDHREVPPIDAIDFMRERIHRDPGEVVLLTVGPTTNAGLLAMADPQAMAELKAVYTMGGRIQPPRAAPRGECNAMLDPAAFAALLAAPVPHQLIAGVEVTGLTGFSHDQVQAAFAGERFAIIGDCIRCCAHAFGKDATAPGTGMHDPFTAACLFQPELATTRRGRMSLVFQDRDFEGRPFEAGQVTGYTPFVADDDGPHHAVTDVDIAAFHHHIAELFARAR